MRSLQEYNITYSCSCPVVYRSCILPSIYESQNWEYLHSCPLLAKEGVLCDIARAVQLSSALAGRQWLVSPEIRFLNGSMKYSTTHFRNPPHGKLEMCLICCIFVFIMNFFGFTKKASGLDWWWELDLRIATSSIFGTDEQMIAGEVWPLLLCSHVPESIFSH